MPNIKKPKSSKILDLLCDCVIDYTGIACVSVEYNPAQENNNHDGLLHASSLCRDFAEMQPRFCGSCVI